METNRKNELKRIYKDLQVQNFINSLPITIEKFKELFDFLDNTDLENTKSNFEKTTEFCKLNNIDTPKLINWLVENGAGDDVEVLYNIEEQIENI